MITEAVTIGVILGGCAAAAWFAKTKFQPEIDRSLARIEAEGEEEIVARRKQRHIE
jgi:hypothetical protein